MRDERGRFIKGNISWLNGKKGLKSWHNLSGIVSKNGEAHPRWKGGKPKCEVCNVSLAKYGAKRCNNHKGELYRERMKSGGAVKARLGNKRKSSIHAKVEIYLEKMGIIFESEKIINNHAVDIFIEPKTIIECDGIYWHSLPKQIERDEKFNNFCKKNSYKLLRLEEEEIRDGSYIQSLLTI